MQPATRVLIIDDDLGFVFWLGQALDAAGFEAIPAKNVPDAVNLITEHQISVDLFILNASLVNAVSLLSALSRAPQATKFVAVVEDPEDTPEDLPDIHAVRAKPDRLDQHSSHEWVRFIQTLVAGRVAAS